MSKLSKLYEKVKRNPRQVRFEELQSLLLRAGFAQRAPRSGSSHRVFVKGDKMITVPYRQPHVLQVYVQLALDALKDVMEDEEDTERD